MPLPAPKLAALSTLLGGADRSLSSPPPLPAAIAPTSKGVGVGMMSDASKREEASSSLLAPSVLPLLLPPPAPPRNNSAPLALLRWLPLSLLLVEEPLTFCCCCCFFLEALPPFVEALAPAPAPEAAPEPALPITAKAAMGAAEMTGGAAVKADSAPALPPLVL